MAINNLSDIGARGVVLFNGESFSYILEDHWRAFKIPNPGADLVQLAELNVVVARAMRSQAVFVNLTEMKVVEQADEPGLAIKENGTEEQALVVIHENGSFFSVSPDNVDELEEGAEGDAGVLVNRGTIVASIPQNDIPSGTWCILVNLPSIAKRVVPQLVPARVAPKTATAAKTAAAGATAKTAAAAPAKSAATATIAKSSKKK